MTGHRSIFILWKFAIFILWKFAIFISDVAEVYREIKFRCGAVIEKSYGVALGKESWPADSLNGLARLLFDHGLHRYKNTDGIQGKWIPYISHPLLMWEMW